MKRVLFDVNVILDVLGNREPFVEDSAAALSLAESGAVTGSIATHTVTTLHYLLERHVGPRRTRIALVDLMRIVEIVPVDGDRLLHALAMGWKDFEDAVQAACAEKDEADYLVTRDKDRFRKAVTQVVTPAELVALLA